MCFVTRASLQVVFLGGVPVILTAMERHPRSRASEAGAHLLRALSNDASFSASLLSEAGLHTWLRLLAVADSDVTGVLDGVWSAVAVVARNGGAIRYVWERLVVAGIMDWLSKQLTRHQSTPQNVRTAALLMDVVAQCFVFTGDQSATPPLISRAAVALSCLTTMHPNEHVVQQAIDATNFLNDASEFVHVVVAVPRMQSFVAACLLSQPGAMAALTSTLLQNGANSLLLLERVWRRRGARTYELGASLLLDERFTLPSLLKVPSFIADDLKATVRFCSDADVVAWPLPHQALVSAVTLAELGDGHGLASDSHLDTLLGATLDAESAPEDAPAVLPNGCGRDWHISALLSAVSAAVRAFFGECDVEDGSQEEEGLSDEEELASSSRPSKRVCTRLHASDVNVSRASVPHAAISTHVFACLFSLT